MLLFTSDQNLWPMLAAMLVAFLSSIFALRLASITWYIKPQHAKWWLITALINITLNAWFIYSLCRTVLQVSEELTILYAALSSCVLVITTFFIAAVDLYIRNHQTSGNVSREHLSQLALVDTLTNLPNRRALMQELEAAIRRSERSGDSFAVAFIDIDNFKPINDMYGHKIGDQILKAVSKSLTAAVRGCDTIARIGGDEFIAVIEEIKTDNDCAEIIERMLNEVRAIHLQEINQINISTSIGVAIYPKDGEVTDVMHAADAAMYLAKKDGKNKFKFFDASIAVASHHLLEIQQDLKYALANNEFKLHYQVKIDSITHEPIGAEALLRWEHPIKGLLHPAEFMDAADRLGMSYAINNWVVEACCRTLHRLNYLHVPFIISANVSFQQLKNPQLIPDTLTMLKRFDLSESRLMFEIAQLTAQKNPALFDTFVASLAKVHIKVVIDDFGIAPISLIEMQAIAVDELKLDRALIIDIAENPKSRAVLQAIIELAHALELNVVASDVETEAQRKILAEIGCDQMQGSLICQPVPEEHLFSLLKTLSAHFEETGAFTMQALKNL